MSLWYVALTFGFPFRAIALLLKYLKKPWPEGWE
jgi:hypothetical protein